MAIAGGAVLIAATYGLVRLNRDGGSPAALLRASFNRVTAEPGIEWFPSLSPDGQWIAYSGDGSGNRDIYLKSVGGQNPLNLTSDSPADDDQPAFSADGQRIAFWSSRDGGGIFVMGRTGEAVRRVTRGGFKPSWSPDGAELAYVTENVELNPQNPNTRSQLWIVGVDTGEPRRLDVLDAVLPSWSPHGHRIAYTGRLGELAQTNIWTVSARGGEPVAVTKDVATDWYPAWSPEGDYLYFASDRGGSMNLWRIPIDEESGVPQGDPEPITTPATALAHISVATDGGSIAYSSTLITANIQTHSLDPELGQMIGTPTWITTGSRLWSSPDPSPDGQRVAFYSLAQPQGNIHLANVDGSGLRLVTGDSAIDRVPRWSPNGDWMAFLSNRGGPFELWRVRPDGSELRQLTQLRTRSIPVWSPDGSRMVASASRGDRRATLVFDPYQPWEAQDPLELPSPDDAFATFAINSWSPDGEHLAGQHQYTDAGIIVYTFRTGLYEGLTDFGEWPVWLPDNRRLLFVTGGNEFHIVDRISKDVRRIFSVGSEVLGPPKLSSDGRQVYYSRRVTEADVWLLTLP
jgi:Tol biopolymer transport system component